MQDREIIELYFLRDESAISETDSKYGALLRQLAFRILSDGGESEECVSDTYFRVWKRIPPERPDYFRAFLAKITRNLSLDRLRARNAEKRRIYEGLASLDELEECVPDGCRESDSQEIAGAINAFLSNLAERERRMFVLRYFYEESVKDIGKALGMSESNVKVTLYRLRARLRARLEKEGIYL